LFIIGFVEEQAVVKGKSRIRGGQTLRDTLFAATENRRLKKKGRSDHIGPSVSDSKYCSVPSVSGLSTVSPNDACTSENAVSANETLVRHVDTPVKLRKNIKPKRIISTEKQGKMQVNTTETSGFTSKRPRRTIHTKQYSDFVYDCDNV